MKLSISLKRSKPAEASDDFEHRDNDTLVENAGPQRIGFDIPTTGDD